MIEEYINHFKGAAIDRLLTERGNWIIVSVDQSIGWPEENYIINYEGFDLFILGYDSERDLLPAVALKLSKKLTEKKAKELIPQFLSCLNWVSSGKIRIESWMGGSFPIRCMNQKAVKYTTSDFRITYLPNNLTEQASIALALLREGDCLNHTHYGYSFLSYFKIINLVKRNGEKQKNG